MGKLLDFADAPLRRHKTVRPALASGAQVVIFPGVRVEPPREVTLPDTASRDGTGNCVDLGARLQKILHGQNGARRPDA